MAIPKLFLIQLPFITVAQSDWKSERNRMQSLPHRAPTYPHCARQENKQANWYTTKQRMLIVGNHPRMIS